MHVIWNLAENIHDLCIGATWIVNNKIRSVVIKICHNIILILYKYFFNLLLLRCQK